MITLLTNNTIGWLTKSDPYKTIVEDTSYRKILKFMVESSIIIQVNDQVSKKANDDLVILINAPDTLSFYATAAKLLGLDYQII